ncbi:MAG: D-alanyl-D-alanine carboxypeptidase family protein, partial [Frankiales bacterium]|nr:D-alanyl-D-alanine carboxypeptidase family protein [Frankiales bacterium]
HMLARQAYMGSALPALPLVLTRDLGAVANLAYLHRSLDRVGAEQQQVRADQSRVGASAAQTLRVAEQQRLSALVDQGDLDQRVTELTDLAAGLAARLQATDARLQQQLAAERLAALTAAQQRAAAATLLVPSTLDTGGAGCLPAGAYGDINGFLFPDTLCPLVEAPGHRLRTDAARSFDLMSGARRAATGAPLCVTDSYRSYAEQVDVFRRKPSLAATPGRSQHGWGLAVDFCGGVQAFGTPAHAWMQANAGRFGWFHPSWAQPDGSRPEPWHWEYAGAALPQ